MESWLLQAHGRLNEQNLAATDRPACNMLRVFQLSGKQLAVLPLERLTTVWTLKKQLRAKLGLPVSLQQLLHNSNKLNDDSKLAPGMNLQLVVISPTSPLDGDCLLEPLELASVGEVEAMRTLLQAVVGQGSSDCLGKALRVALSAGKRLKAGTEKNWGKLLKASAQNNSRNNSGCVGLMNVGAGHVSVAGLLLEAGADKDWANEKGQTALMRASASGQINVAHLLVVVFQVLCAPASSSKCATLAKPMLRTCCWKLVQGRTLEDNDSRTALMYGCANGNVDIARLLLEAGADKDWVNEKGQTSTTLAYASAVAHLL